jgi:hypothetical protein
MWKAIDLQFRLIKPLLPYPYSYNPTSRKLYFQSKINKRTLPWVLLTSSTMIMILAVTVGILAKELLSSQTSELSYMQLLSLSAFCIYSIYSVTCIYFCLKDGDVTKWVFNELVLLESLMRKGKLIELGASLKNNDLNLDWIISMHATSKIVFGIFVPFLVYR